MPRHGGCGVSASGSPGGKSCSWASRGGYFEIPIWLQDIPLVLTITARLKWLKEALKVEFEPWLWINKNDRDKEDFAANQLTDAWGKGHGNHRKWSNNQAAAKQLEPWLVGEIKRLEGMLVPPNFPGAAQINAPIVEQLYALRRELNRVRETLRPAPGALEKLGKRFARLTDLLNLANAYAGQIKVEYEVYSKVSELVQLVSVPVSLAPPRQLLLARLQNLVRELSDA